MKTYFRILSYAKPYGRFVIPYFFFTIISVLFGLVTFYMLVPMLDIMFNDIQTPSSEPPAGFAFTKEYFNEISSYYYGRLSSISGLGMFGPLFIVCVVIVSSNLLSNVFKYLGARVLNKARFEVVRKIKNATFDKLMHMEVSFFSDARKGDLLSRFSFDMVNIEYLITDSLKGFIRDPFTLIFYLGFLIFISWKLTLIAMVILPFGGLLVSLITGKLKRAARLIDESNGELMSISEESFTGVRVIKSFTSESFVSSRFGLVNATNARARFKHDTRLELSGSISEVFGMLMVAIILYVGGRHVLQQIGELKASEFIAYLGLFSQVIIPAKSLVQCVNVIQKGLLSAQKIFDILDRKVLIVDDARAVDKKHLEHGIQITNLNFRYDEKYVLKNINLFIPKGKTVALVGPSGSGKTTLADLVSRFYDVHEGSIEFDGIDIKKIRQNSLRAMIGIVAQESLLFNDTIRQNILLGKENISPAEIETAAQAANAHDFIIKQTNGYDTRIGDRGNKLSGGQKQRISIARALLKNPEVLVLDEATSALDAESERMVQDALERLMHSRTSIVIAHRLSTVMHADLIVVLNEGEIVEQGNHGELLAKNGFYKRLVSLQTDLV
ncbi:MAG: ABC transporter ATP-binding protein [Saprospiraceae bacterium]|nr:ABC transporter ATP-binding protein [Saprospiraceae bacterium]